MRAVVQRVRSASVSVNDETVGRIGRGLLVLLGVGRDDTDDDARYLSEKIVNLRIFDDDEGKMNLSVLDVGGSVLIVSQFTLYGDCRRGRRPSYTESAPPELAKRLYEYFVDVTRGHGLEVQTGIFAARMLVTLENDGPVTILLDSKKVF